MRAEGNAWHANDRRSEQNGFDFLGVRYEFAGKTSVENEGLFRGGN